MTVDSESSAETFPASADVPLRKKYGVTRPLSLTGPSQADLHRNEELEKFLRDSGLYESDEETRKREQVLCQLDQIVKLWVKQLTRQRGYSDQMVEDANAIILTFGSYQLGVSKVLSYFMCVRIYEIRLTVSSFYTPPTY
ncbi:unnamed protein product [Cuscuta campestris]|uniref:Poly(A) polymerase nucleotidyltransferase domain-containing protein n=1 Tax=Cuscuta campestris TaxID=132261 RepID=A0A484M0E7_9ASTE|nr:unnamed protein product [Cuscuta campestris]